MPEYDGDLLVRQIFSELSGLEMRGLYENIEKIILSRESYKKLRYAIIVMDGRFSGFKYEIDNKQKHDYKIILNKVELNI